MGPVAGIGDSLIVGTLIPVILGIAIGLSTWVVYQSVPYFTVVWNLLAYLE
ncbi:PTS system mannose/fructose/sorbose family transporter subunit IID [Streptococcus sp.]|uniref:PTS system mannose/fructose/sorbose family transporter subunit IID n=1 Tax=Streptococcus sp. TaxID=1306 RepID=UPI00391CE767